MSNGLQVCSLVVDETPYAVWDSDVAATNRAFLEGIDPGYFFHVVRMHVPALEKDDRQHAALALRLAYSQALETFFALLAAAVQAPQCPAAWMLLYKTEELRSVVRKLETGCPVLSRLSVPLDWLSLSREINRFQLQDAENDERTKRSFATAWSRFAGEFLDVRATGEYNSLKHGLRARRGGFALGFSIQKERGVPPAPDAMQLLGGSEYGASFYKVERLSPDKSYRHNIRLKHTFLNWNPEAVAAGVELLGVSIANVVSYLLGRNGRSWKDLVFYNAAEEDFAAPWRFDHTCLSLDMDVQLPSAPSPLLTKQHVLGTYGSTSE